MKQGTYENPLTLEEFLDNFREAQELINDFPGFREGKWVMTDSGTIRFKIPTSIESVDCFCPLTFQAFIQSHKVFICSRPGSASLSFGIDNSWVNVIIAADSPNPTTQYLDKLRQKLLKITGLQD